MTHGYLPGLIPKGCEVEARIQSCIMGATILNTINVSPGELDWNHPDTISAFKHNLQVTTKQSGLLSHGGNIRIP